MLTVKDNQPTLRALLENALRAHAACHVTRDKGHGRAETRSHLVMDAPEEVKALFPPAEQVARVARTRTVTSWLSDGHTRTRVARTCTETVYLIITMPAREAPPEHIAVCIRRHWSIENRVHHVRSPGVLLLLCYVALECPADSFCNTSRECGARCPRCPEALPARTCNKCNTLRGDGGKLIKDLPARTATMS